MASHSSKLHSLLSFFKKTQKSQINSRLSSEINNKYFESNPFYKYHLPISYKLIDSLREVYDRNGSNFSQQGNSFAIHSEFNSKIKYYITAATFALSSIVLAWKTQVEQGEKCDGFFSMKKASAQLDEFENAPKSQKPGLEKIAKFLTKAKYSVDYNERESHSTDTSLVKGKVPELIVYPESTEDVSQILKICNEYNIPVLPYGSGTSLEGNAVCLKGGIVINLSRMNKIEKISVEDSDVTVQAGIQWMNLNDEIKHTGLFYPIDPGPGASIGGMIATRCSGTNAVKYGVMKDWILTIKVVLIDGSILKFGTKARKDAAGYDFVRLFCGSDGTLGIITEATLKLAPIPQHEYVAICTFPSIKNACNCVNDLTHAGVQIGCAELLDSETVKVLNSELENPLEISPCIMFKFTGNKAQVEEAISISQKMAQKNGGKDFNYRTTETGSKELWNARKYLFNAYISSLEEPYATIGTDVCVPVSKLPEIATIAKKDFNAHGITAMIFGHVGDGNFHMTVTYNKEDPKHLNHLNTFYAKLIELAIQAGGTCTGEHGIGIGKKKYLKMMYPKEVIDLMKKTKSVFDPKGLMNPGKVFDLD